MAGVLNNIKTTNILFAVTDSKKITVRRVLPWPPKRVYFTNYPPAQSGVRL